MDGDIEFKVSPVNKSQGVGTVGRVGERDPHLCDEEKVQVRIGTLGQVKSPLSSL